MYNHYNLSDKVKSKTKCIFVCGDKKNLARPAPLTLWVSTATHLGHELSETGNMEYDVRVKRASFISSSVEVRETFKFASPVEVLHALKVYCSSFLWLYAVGLGCGGSNGSFQFLEHWSKIGMVSSQSYQDILGTAGSLSWSNICQG